MALLWKTAVEHIAQCNEIHEMPADEFMAKHQPGHWHHRWDMLESNDQFNGGGDDGWNMSDLVHDMKHKKRMDSPVTVEDGEVTDGHHRVLAAEQAGVPVRYRHDGDH